MKARLLGISKTMTIALLIAVAVVLVIMLYINSTKMIGGEVVRGAAYLIGDQYVTSGGTTTQYVTIGIRLTSKTDKPLTVKAITLNVLSGSSTRPMTIVITGDADSTPIDVTPTPRLPVTLAPGSTQEIQVTLSREISDPIVSVTITVTLADAAGNTRTINLGQISVV